MKLLNRIKSPRRSTVLQDELSQLKTLLLAILVRHRTPSQDIPTILRQLREQDPFERPTPCERVTEKIVDGLVHGVCPLAAITISLAVVVVGVCFVVGSIDVRDEMHLIFFCGALWIIHLFAGILERNIATKS